MARFRGLVTGGRGTASRLGHAKDGLTTVANGWSGGVRVHLYDRDGEDHARIELTGGSNDPRPFVVIYDGPINDAARAAVRDAREAA